jgi:hypothetical protein
MHIWSGFQRPSSHIIRNPAAGFHKGITQCDTQRDSNWEPIWNPIRFSHFSHTRPTLVISSPAKMAVPPSDNLDKRFVMSDATYATWQLFEIQVLKREEKKTITIVGITLHGNCNLSCSRVVWLLPWRWYTSFGSNFHTKYEGERPFLSLRFCFWKWYFGFNFHTK